MTGSASDRFKGRFRGTFRGVKTALVPALLAAGLAGCSAYEYVTDKISDPIVLSCPEYLVIADAASLVRFRDGPGRDLIDVDFETEIIRVQLACTSNIDRKTRVGTGSATGFRAGARTAGRLACHRPTLPSRRST